jgi:hypothetical protein
MEGATSKIKVEHVEPDVKLPLWVVAYHRLARLNKADKVIPGSIAFPGGRVLDTMVRFNLTGPARFGDLKDAETAWLLYK